MVNVFQKKIKVDAPAIEFKKKMWFPFKSERGAREPRQVVYLNFLIITSSRIVSFFFHLNCRGIELDVSK